VAVGEVYTLELGAMTPGGFCGLEELVVVTPEGCRFLTPPETREIIVRPCWLRKPEITIFKDTL